LARREDGRGDRKDGSGPVRSFVPDGTRLMFTPQPSDKSLGYFRASLRDVESQRAKHVRTGTVRSGGGSPDAPSPGSGIYDLGKRRRRRRERIGLRRHRESAAGERDVAQVPV